MLWSSTIRLWFSTKASIICHLGMPHRQFMPCDWYPSIYNLWARTSQRRALSKRINSPSPNRCIFNRDQSTQNKIQCPTHNPFTSSFWVWTKRRHLIPLPYVQYRREALAYPSISKYVWTITTYYLVLCVQPNKDISNHPNDVKTSGLQPPSSSSTYRRISYLKWV